MKAWIWRKLVQPFVELLKQGVSPEQIALTVALGVALGTIPVIGSTTLLCTLAAVTLRLNLPAILLVNGVVYPLQLTLVVPFLRAGAWLFHVQGPKLTIGQIFTDSSQRVAHHRYFMDRDNARSARLADRLLHREHLRLLAGACAASALLEECVCGKLMAL